MHLHSCTQNVPVSRLVDLRFARSGILSLLSSDTSRNSETGGNSAHGTEYDNDDVTEKSSKNSYSEMSSLQSFFFFSSLKSVLYKAFDRAEQPRVVSVSSMFDYLVSTSKEKVKQKKRVMHNLQFFVIHNTMDFGCVDVRRSRACMELQPSPFPSPFWSVSQDSPAYVHGHKRRKKVNDKCNMRRLKVCSTCTGCL